MVAGADAIPFPDASMDGLVSFGVLYYLSEAEMRAAFDEIRRVLKPGGKALIVTRGQDDDRCRRAARIGGSMYRLGSLGEGAPSEAEADMVMTFVDRTDIERLASGFASASVDTMHFSEGNGAFMNADWYIQLVR
jgi:ubiquinone/menaquinone biosynthesis C-methylase UbiE